MSESNRFEQVSVVPGGRAMLSFSCLVPTDWQRIPLPDEQYDFEKQPELFMPMLMCMAGYGAVIFMVGARPAYGDGTLRDWVQYLAGQNKLSVQSMQETTLNGCPGLLVEALQQSDAGLMRVRTVFLEDGGRFVTVSGIAPQEIWVSVESVLVPLVDSFKFDEVKGPSVPISPEPARTGLGEKIEHPKPDIDLAALTAPAVEDEDPHANANPAPASNDRPTQPADVALMDDPSCLDPEHPQNVRMRERGIGLTPRVLMTATREKFCTIGAGAIVACFRVPFGWHALDDGQRTLIYDHVGKMQINFDLRTGNPGDEPAMLKQIREDLSNQAGGFQWVEFEASGLPCMGIRNLVINGERLQQAYIVGPSFVDGKRLVCRVTADDDRIEFALNAAGMMVLSMTQLPPVQSNEPEWWTRAVELEQQGRLKDAEQSILKAVDHLGAYASVAHLYELRGQRFRSAGQEDLALEAFRESCR